MSVTVEIKTSPRKDKKLVAIFRKDGDKIKTIHFGAKNMDDYTLTSDKAQRKRYRDRTRTVYNKSPPMSASRLSGDILWGDSVSRSININSYKKKYGFK